MPKKTKTIAPRLFTNDVRERYTNSLPMEIKEGLRSIARVENKSMSWVVEQVIIDYFNFRRPKYKLPRK